jgi:internalin A
LVKVRAYYGQRPDASPKTKTGPPQPLATPPQVFVSYAWGDTSSIAPEEDRQRQEVVGRLCRTLEKENWHVVRDKTALRYGDLISPFMKTLGQPDLVIVVLSAKYLQSPYCMTELHALYQNTRQEKQEFLNRIIPLVLKDARIGTPEERVQHAKHWETRYMKLKADLDYLSPEDFSLYQGMKYWYNHVGRMLTYVNDVLHPHGFEDIVKDDFAALRQMLSRRR